MVEKIRRLQGKYVLHSHTFTKLCGSWNRRPGWKSRQDKELRSENRQRRLAHISSAPTGRSVLQNTLSLTGLNLPSLQETTQVIHRNTTLGNNYQRVLEVITVSDAKFIDC